MCPISSFDVIISSLQTVNWPSDPYLSVDLAIVRFMIKEKSRSSQPQKTRVLEIWAWWTDCCNGLSCPFRDALFNGLNRWINLSCQNNDQAYSSLDLGCSSAKRSGLRHKVPTSCLLSSQSLFFYLVYMKHLSKFESVRVSAIQWKFIEFQSIWHHWENWGAFDSAKNLKRQRRKRQSVTAKREKSQTPKFV